MADSSEQLEFVPATAADSDRLSDIIFGEPGQVTTDVAMRAFGIEDFRKARQLWRLLNRKGEAWRSVTLARTEGRTVGVLMRDPVNVSVSPGLLLRALAMLGPGWLVRLPGRLRLQRRVHSPAPDGAYRVSELHVDPEFRGGGIGGALLAEAEAQARAERRDVMTLEVLITNPAIRLYDRAGFEIVTVSTDERYRRLTGVAGNYRMDKHLD